MLNFSTSPHTWPMKSMLNWSPLNIHKSHTNHNMHSLVNVCSTHTITRFKLQEYKTCSLQFIFLHTCDLETVKVIKPTMTVQVIIKVIAMQSLKDLALKVSEKKLTLKGSFQMRKCQFPLEHVRKSKIVAYSWSTWCNQQSYKVWT